MDLNQPWECEHLKMSFDGFATHRVVTEGGSLIGYFENEAIAQRVVLDHEIARAAVRYDRPAEDGKYGLVACSKKQFHPGEPVFILRATDPITPHLVVTYGSMCLLAGCTEAFGRDVEAHWDRIVAWQEANPALVKKVPD